MALPSPAASVAGSVGRPGAVRPDERPGVHARPDRGGDGGAADPPPAGGAPDGGRGWASDLRPSLQPLAVDQHAKRPGRIAMLAELAMTGAFFTTTDPGVAVAPLDLKVNLLRPVMPDSVTSLPRRDCPPRRTISIATCRVANPTANRWRSRPAPACTCQGARLPWSESSSSAPPTPTRRERRIEGMGLFDFSGARTSGRSRAGTPEFEAAVQGSAIPDSQSVSMGEPAGPR